ncbi:MAG TPA: hypothetical protein VM938_06160 [Acidimicrobiales bacterium]|nr:hypothetical protein [Acidimicrobiales bacterium]
MNQALGLHERCHRRSQVGIHHAVCVDIEPLEEGLVHLPPLLVVHPGIEPLGVGQ